MIKKRGIMGIGTLIIFIATILVAAVAAGVLISTSGILQSKSLLVGQTSRKEITNAVKIISVMAEGNETDESLNNYEILVSLNAGSDPLHMETVDLQYTTGSADAAAILQHPSLNNNTDTDLRHDQTFYYQVGAVNNGSWTVVGDIDKDGLNDYVMIAPLDIPPFNETGFNTTSWLIFNFSNEAIGDNVSVNMTVDIGRISSIEVNEKDLPIAGNDGLWYGFVKIYGNVTENSSINDSVDFRVSANALGDCSFAALRPEKRYCYEVMHGDEDTILDHGERFKIFFKMRQANRLLNGEDFTFLLFSNEGRITEATAIAPDVINSPKIRLWPIG